MASDKAITTTATVIKHSRSNNRINKNIILWVVSHTVAILFGINVGSVIRVTTTATTTAPSTKECPPCPFHSSTTSTSQQLRLDTSSAVMTSRNMLQDSNSKQQLPQQTTTTTNLQGKLNSSSPSITTTMKKIFMSMGRVNRDNFLQTFDIGVPIMPSSDGNEEVLLLYDQHSYPDHNDMLLMQQGIPRFASTQDATKNCKNMKVLLTFSEEPNHCLAIVGQWDSYIIQKWMRISSKKKASFDQPFALVSRSRQRYNKFLSFDFENSNEQQQQQQPTGSMLEDHDYSRRRRDKAAAAAVLERLRTILQTLVTAANNNKNKNNTMNNTIIIMMCNLGQAELFINFVCSARVRGIDTSQVLLAATDPETKQLAEQLGIATFYDEELFGNLPRVATNQYLDASFKQFMLAKVSLVRMIHSLGYNVLFQDVDVMWYRNPLEYFASLPNKNSNNNSQHTNDDDDDAFDMYFQDDGTRLYSQEPYFANGGFFLVRQHNQRTKYFWSALTRQTDLILAYEEQTAMNFLIQEHMSLTGLRVKILNRNDEQFLSGWHFHRQPELMKRFMKEDNNKLQQQRPPYIFHMSWTNGKTEKLQFLEQMGYLFVSHQCTGDRLKERMSSTGTNHSTATTRFCCVDKPIVKCHYRDKPSKIPCHDSPPLDKDAPSFWA